MPWGVAAAAVGGIAAGALMSGGGGNSQPSNQQNQTDYANAATAQANSSQAMANAQTYANRPTINTPWGSQYWQNDVTTDPATGQPVTTWTQNTALTPTAQHAMDTQQQMQQGRTDIANALMPSAAEAITTPIDYSQFSDYGSAPTASNFQNISASAPLQTSFSAAQGMPGEFSYGQKTNDFSHANNLGNFTYTNNQTPFSTNSGQIQKQLDLSNVSQMPTYDRQFVNDAFNEALNYMRPDQERASTALDAKLANMGLTPGSEAWKTAERQLGDQQSRDKYNALQTAYNQGNQMFNNQLNANNQSFNQALNTGNFANSAQNQQFNQANQAWQNNFNMNNQLFNQQNQAWQNNYNLENMKFNQDNQSWLNNFNRDNQAFSQANQSWLNNYNLGNTSFNQAQQEAAFANSAANQQFQNEYNAAQMNNVNAQNAFNQQQSIANYNNTLRAAQIAEAQQRQLQPLNNINALISGQQVSMPNMPSFSQAGSGQAAQYLSALNGANAYGLQQQSMQNAADNSQMAGIGSLLGQAGSAAAAYYGYSDKRLKTEIKKVGTRGKFNWYRFRFVGDETWHEGVIAQEVKKIMPEAVKRAANGFLMVNYAMIGV